MKVLWEHLGLIVVERKTAEVRSTGVGGAQPARCENRSWPWERLAEGMPRPNGPGEINLERQITSRVMRLLLLEEL